METILAKDGLTYRLIDFGLPSGTLWADRAIGAEKPADLTKTPFERDENGKEYFLTQGFWYRQGDIRPFTPRNAPADRRKEFGMEKIISAAIDKNGEFVPAMEFKGNPMSPKNLQIQVFDQSTLLLGEPFSTPSMEDWKELIENTDIQYYMRGGLVKRENSDFEGIEIRGKGEYADSVLYLDYYNKISSDNGYGAQNAAYFWTSDNGVFENDIVRGKLISFYQGDQFALTKGIKFYGVCQNTAMKIIPVVKK